VDAVVHPAVRGTEQLREFQAEPWKSKAMPAAERYFYPNPIGEFAAEAKQPEGPSGSDPDAVAGRLFGRDGCEQAILLPLTRGLMPDPEHGSSICAATNDWLAATWLGSSNADGRFKGSIRVNPLDPAGAAKEVERWAGHPDMVQVALPLQAHHPYGQRLYLPLWETVAKHDLPVVIHADGGAGVEFWPTAVGYPRHFIEYAALNPLNGYFHLLSFICEGVFDRFENFRVLFADGGFDFLTPFIWRMDKGWLSLRSETPWVSKLPVRYLEDHVRFAYSRHEGPAQEAEFSRWLEMGGDRLLLYASNYPYWDSTSPKEVAERFAGDESRRRVLGENAKDFYRL